MGLNVIILGRDDPLWQAYWELYVRAEVYIQAGQTRPTKLFFDRESTLPAY